MAKSIMQTERKCYICGRRTELELHHICGAANRKRSDKDGLMVWLCHNCHNEPPNGVHHNAAINDQLKAVAQRRWMEHYGKTADDFLKRYGKNYI